MMNVLYNGASNFPKENKNFIKWINLNSKKLKNSKLNISVYFFKKEA